MSTTTKMAIMPYTDYEAACNKIREYSGKTELIKSGELSAEIEQVYEAGQKAEYDTTEIEHDYELDSYCFRSSHSVGDALNAFYYMSGYRVLGYKLPLGCKQINIPNAVLEQTFAMGEAKNCIVLVKGYTSEGGGTCAVATDDVVVTPATTGKGDYVITVPEGLGIDGVYLGTQASIPVLSAIHKSEAYADGYTDGYAVGNPEANYNKGYTEGKQAEYDVFWDETQANGTRADYRYAFYGRGWTDNNFKPKYPIALTGGDGSYIFKQSGFKKPDLSKVDFSKSGSALQIFMESSVVELGVLDFSSVLVGYGGLNQTFMYCHSLEKIEKIILPKAETNANGFYECTSLKEIRFEGTTYKELNLQWSPLSKASIENVISCLADDASDQTVTFNANAVNTAFETSEGANDGSTSAEWLALIATKPNWTISLV